MQKNKKKNTRWFLLILWLNKIKQDSKIYKLIRWFNFLEIRNNNWKQQIKGN